MGSFSFRPFCDPGVPKWSTIICYPHTCYQTHLLSTQLLSNLVCYEASTAIHTFASKPHLLSGQFAINAQLHSTLLLSLIICYTFSACSRSTFLLILFLKIQTKNRKFLKNFEFFIFWHGHGVGLFCWLK